MIKAVLPGDGFSAAGLDPYSAMLHTAHAIYGEEAQPRFWREEGSGALCALSGDGLILSGRFSSMEDLVSLWVITGAETLRGKKEDVAPLAQYLQKEPQIRRILSADRIGQLSDIPAAGKIVFPSPAKVFPLLQTVFSLPDRRFPAWYCESSHKVRHKLGCIAAIEEAETVAATAGIYHQNERAALISSVATHPDCRGKGYAAQLCRFLAEKAIAQGRCAFVICREPAAIRVYRRVGFVPWGEEWVLAKK
ncbi:MAG: GNAT family N-acetyltransferase [Clostridia bacterium]|nr:GNAT family N-acetyltransferase [Clostridia bacterium]